MLVWDVWDVWDLLVWDQLVWDPLVWDPERFDGANIEESEIGSVVMGYLSSVSVESRVDIFLRSFIETSVELTDY